MLPGTVATANAPVSTPSESRGSFTPTPPNTLAVVTFVPGISLFCTEISNASPALKMFPLYNSVSFDANV